MLCDQKRAWFGTGKGGPGEGIGGYPSIKGRGGGCIGVRERDKGGEKRVSKVH